MKHAPGAIRDGILEFLEALDRDASVGEIHAALSLKLGLVASSSVRSYLTLNASELFERTGYGRYRLRSTPPTARTANISHVHLTPAVQVGKAKLFHADCFEWLAGRAAGSFHAVVTDPPYGASEYSEKEVAKLRAGKGGVWRVPPSFDGNRRAPLPRFTTMSQDDHTTMFASFRRLGALLGRVLVPGGNVVIATNPLLSHLVVGAMVEAGLEMRGYIARLTQTMRGGDRPKNAHHEFDGVSVMPRSQWEPWVVLRKPVEGRVQDNLRQWGTGGFRRPSADQPFGDVIRSRPTPRAERSIAPHPSLKPQEFLRQVVRASLPLGEGVVLDPFAGSGSTLAAANAVGYVSIGVESDAKFVRLAGGAIEKLGAL